MNRPVKNRPGDVCIRRIIIQPEPDRKYISFRSRQLIRYCEMNLTSFVPPEQRNLSGSIAVRDLETSANKLNWGIAPGSNLANNYLYSSLTPNYYRI